MKPQEFELSIRQWSFAVLVDKVRSKGGLGATRGIPVIVIEDVSLAVPLAEVLVAGGLPGWQQDPGVELDPRITAITGISDEELAGQTIDDNFAMSLLDRADLTVAQNAIFDVNFIERRYPQMAGLAWACSCSEIDWLELGFDGRAQQHLLAQAGWFGLGAAFAKPSGCLACRWRRSWKPRSCTRNLSSCWR